MPSTSMPTPSPTRAEHGQTGNGEARITVTGRLDNRGGTLSSKGRAKLSANDLDNRSSAGRSRRQ